MADPIVEALVEAQQRIYRETGRLVEVTARVDDHTFDRLYMTEMGTHTPPYVYTKYFSMRTRPMISVRRASSVVV